MYLDARQESQAEPEAAEELPSDQAAASRPGKASTPIGEKWGAWRWNMGAPRRLSLWFVRIPPGGLQLR